MSKPSVLYVLTVLLIAAGCGGDQFPTAPVSGVVKSGGQPLTGGKIVFVPQASDGNTMVGKSATGYIESDGSFVLSTYSNGDGAVEGKHSVVVTGPVSGEMEEGEREGPEPQNVGSTTEVFEVSADSDNVFEIDLTPPAAKRNQRGRDPDDDD